MNGLNRFNCRLKLSEYILALIISIIIMVWSLGLLSADLRIPFNNAGDSLFFYAMTKTIIETGWVFCNNQLGAPYGLEMYDFPLNNTLDILIIKIISFFTSDSILVENVFYLLTYPLTTLTSMITFRELKINYAYSVLGSLLFTFIPYHFLRGVGHLNLSSYFIVPLMVMVILWIYSNKLDLFKVDNVYQNRSRLSDNRLIASILICILSGLVFFYYIYFFCFFLLVAGFCSSIAMWRKTPFFTSFILIILIVLITILNQSPTIIYQWQYGENAEVAIRSPFETEFYGLKITQLLMPINGHRIPLFARLASYYDGTAPLVNENSYASLGIIGSLGFLFLLGMIFFRVSSKYSIQEHDLAMLSRLSVLNLSAVLYATIGGFSSVIAYSILAQFRSINRISIFIAFFSITSILIILKYISNKHIKATKRNIIICIISFIILIVGILDQTSDSFIPSYASIKEEYNIDGRFVNDIEAIMPENAMIFQLPYLPFPEYGLMMNKMDGYSHFRAYLHSNDLRWSYGVMKGRPGDAWQKGIASMPVKDMINVLSQTDFEGIYIDSYGFEDSGANIISNITKILEEKPLTSDNGRLYFFDMTKYNKRIRDNSFNREKIPIIFDSGWHDIENWSGVSSRWMPADATIIEYSAENRMTSLSFQALSFYRNRTLEIYSGDKMVSRVTVPTRIINVTAPVPLTSGLNIMRFHVPEGCERPCDKMELNTDSRCMSLAVQNVMLA